MFASFRSRIAPFLQRLTRTADDQPLHKLALAIVILLDLFILVSIFDGLEAHTRQLATPEERVPALCREIVVDREWTPARRMERLSSRAAERRSAWRDPSRKEPRVEPACERFLAPLSVIAANEGVGARLENRQRLGGELEQAERELLREKGAYDTQLLERLARPAEARPDAEAILAAVQARTEAIEAARRRVAEIDAAVGGDPAVKELWARLDALGPADSAALAAQVRRLQRWHAVQRLGMQLLFLLPLLAAFAYWHGASVRRGRGTQALLSSHLVVIAAIPVLFRVVEFVYDVVPRRLLRRLFALLEELKLVAIWHYLVIAAAVAIGLALVVLVQRRLFSRAQLAERRISAGRCQACGRKLAAGAKACHACGFLQGRACPACGGTAPARARHCTACGAPVPAA